MRKPRGPADDGKKYPIQRLQAPAVFSHRTSSNVPTPLLVILLSSSMAVCASRPADGVRSLSAVRCISEELIEGMLTELDGYTTAARDFEADRADFDAFTTSVLKFWRTHCSRLPTCAKAAHIIFALSPNSASCERVFSLLASMHTPEQKGTLGDALQASLMLRYNKREVGCVTLR